MPRVSVRAGTVCLGMATAFLTTSVAPLAGQWRTSDGPAGGEEGAAPTGWFPESLVVRPLLGSSTSVDIGSTPMIVRRGPPAGSDNVSPEARVGFGYRLPVFRFRERGPALDLAVEAGVRARFALGTGANGLRNADFRVAVPVGARTGRWEGSVAPVHVSSHLGDDFLEQNPEFETSSISNNGVEALLVYSLLPELRAYAGGDYNFATAGVETVAGRIGVDFVGRRSGDAGIRPLGAFEVTTTDLTERLSLDALAGIGIRAGSAELRLALTAHTGPSSMGHFRVVDERFVGVLISVAPGVVVRSWEG